MAISVGCQVERLDGDYTKGDMGEVIEVARQGDVVRIRVLWHTPAHPGRKPIRTWCRVRSLKVVLPDTAPPGQPSKADPLGDVFFDP